MELKAENFLKVLKMSEKIKSRKLDHLTISLTKKVESNKPPGFNDVTLIHNALPEINKNEIDLSINLFGCKLNAPLIIEPMTGGTFKAIKINASLAEAAEKLKIGIGVGSQRAALEDPSLKKTYTIVREKASTTLVLANIGCSQILGEEGIEKAKEAVEMINANALTIHLNSLQESIQPEGETKFKGVLNAISQVIKKLNVPVIIKETGAGISMEVAKKLENIGVKFVDIAGLGGTSWASVEYYRAKANSNKILEALGKTFWDWGIPTVASLIEVKSSTKIKVIASGGIRTGLDAAKSIALGAEAVGLALPLLKHAIKGVKQTMQFLKIIIEELKTAMFLTGSKNLIELKNVPVVISGETAIWLFERGINLNNFYKA
jgi:isopentenyl-diphosphate delta-isomerase